jgi:hypothetical protein
MNALELTQRLQGRWHGAYGMARCPAHEDRNPSLSVGEGRGGTVLLKCFAGCEQQRVIDALRLLNLWQGAGGQAREPTAAEQEAQRKRESERERERRHCDAFVKRSWEETWRTAAPPPRSPIEAWLLARGIDQQDLDLGRLPLRWTPRCPHKKATAPAMVALMTDPITAAAVGLHRTFLLPDGSAKAFGKDSRQFLGPAGVIRLSPDDEVTEGLGICEGIETGLAVMATGWRPIWACGSLNGLKQFPVLAVIGCLTIFADPKPHEVAGARACAARWAAAGREAVVRIPNPRGDWNDLLRAAA